MPSSGAFLIIFLLGFSMLGHAHEGATESESYDASDEASPALDPQFPQAPKPKLSDKDYLKNLDEKVKSLSDETKNKTDDLSKILENLDSRIKAAVNSDQAEKKPETETEADSESNDKKSEDKATLTDLKEAREKIRAELDRRSIALSKRAPTPITEAEPLAIKESIEKPIFSPDASLIPRTQRPWTLPAAFSDPGNYEPNPRAESEPSRFTSSHAPEWLKGWGSGSGPLPAASGTRSGASDGGAPVISVVPPKKGETIVLVLPPKEMPEPTVTSPGEGSTQGTDSPPPTRPTSPSTAAIPSSGWSFAGAAKAKTSDVEKGSGGGLGGSNSFLGSFDIGKLFGSMASSTSSPTFSPPTSGNTGGSGYSFGPPLDSSKSQSEFSNLKENLSAALFGPGISNDSPPQDPSFQNDVATLPQPAKVYYPVLPGLPPQNTPAQTPTSTPTPDEAAPEIALEKPVEINPTGFDPRVPISAPEGETSAGQIPKTPPSTLLFNTYKAPSRVVVPRGSGVGTPPSETSSLSTGLTGLRVSLTP